MSPLRDEFVAEDVDGATMRSLVGAVGWALRFEAALAELLEAEEGAGEPTREGGAPASHTEPHEATLQALLGLSSLSRRLVALDPGESEGSASPPSTLRGLLR